MKALLTSLSVLLLVTSCQLLSNSGTATDHQGDTFLHLAKMKGEWDITSEVQVGFELFENSEAEAKVRINGKGRSLKERVKGYYKDDKWRVETIYNVIGPDSLEVVIEDSRDTTESVYRGSFIDGFLSVEALDGKEKMEMRLLDDRLVKKIFKAAPYREEDWELVLHWEYERD